MDPLLDAPQTSHPCGSVDELQLQLRGLLNASATATRADHVEVTFRLRSNATFHVDISDPENEALESAATSDSLLGGARSNVEAVNGNHVPRQINANDVLMNQPQDNPVLQKAVSKHLITALGEVDRSNWSVGEVSRGAQGWTFTYICKDSWQAWKRQNSKSSARIPIAEHSGKDGNDPVNLSRPAFDCRGSVTIAFVQTSRSINVKYDHTPLHKTVAQLIELYAPPPAPTSNKRAAEPTPEGETRRKRRKKTAGVVLPLDPLEAIPAEKQKRKYKPRARKSAAVDGAGASGSGPNAELQSPAVSQSGVHGLPGLVLSPGEAEKRRGLAISLLTEHGIDPASLSDDQFNVFAHQSQELQKESLAMLVEYGAERLRIIHSSASQSAEASASSGTQPPDSTTPSEQDNVAGEATNRVSPSGKETPQKKNSVSPTDASADVDVTNTANPQPGRTKPRETRGACATCRENRFKCAKERPACTQCLESGSTCYYPPPKPQARRSRAKNAEEVEDVQDGVIELGVAAEPDGDGEPDVVTESNGAAERASDAELDDLGSPGFHGTPVSPQSNMTQTPTEDYQNSYSGIELAQEVVPDLSQSLMPSASRMDYGYTPSQPFTEHAQPSHPIYPPPQSPSGASLSEQDSDSLLHLRPQTSSKQSETSRRSPPTEPATQPQVTASSTPAQGDFMSTWNASSRSTVPLSQVDASTPPAKPDRSARKLRPRNVAKSVTVNVQEDFDGMQQAAAISQSAVQLIANSSTVVQNASYQQSQKAQTYTPLRETALAQEHQQQVPPAQPGTGHHNYSTSAAADSSTFLSYGTQSRYSNGTSDQSSSRVAYEPYIHNTSSAGSYQSYDTYSNTPSTLPSSVPLPNTTVSGVSSGYTSTSGSTDEWSTASQSCNSHSYSTNSTTRPNTFGQPASSAQQSHSPQRFNVHPQPSTQTRNASGSSYHQQTQQQSQETQLPQQQQQQQQSYGAYPSQSHASTGQLQNWYGFASATNMLSNYGSGSADGSGPYGRQHQSTNMPGRRYNNIDGGDQVLYSLLQTNSEA